MSLKKSITVAAITLISSSALTPLLSTSAIAGTFTVKGKCAFLLDQSYNEKCTILIKKGYLSVLTGRSSVEKIFGQQISDFNLANKTTLRMDENLALYDSAVPWWTPWNKVPKWVKNATKKTNEQHEIVLGYVNTQLNNPANLVLITLDDPSKAAGFVRQLSKITGLRVGEKTIPGSELSPSLKLNLLRDAKKQAQRINGLCRQRMYNDAEPVLNELDTFAYNASNNISMFLNSETTITKIENISEGARQVCENEFKRELAELAAAERARLAAIRAREAAKRAALIRSRAAAAAAEQQKRRAAYDLLASY